MLNALPQHLVKDLDALGGIMGQVADRATIQNKILNKSKGRAGWSLRSQVDKIKYTEILITICALSIVKFLVQLR